MSSEITLTGGTLMGDPNAPPSISANNNKPTDNNAGVSSLAMGHAHAHSHSHSHAHSHGSHCPYHGAGQVEMPTVQGPSVDEVVNSTNSEIIKSFSTLLRFGRFEAFDPLMKAIMEKKDQDTIIAIFSQMDEGGHTVLHWAAKRVDDLRFLKTFLDLFVSREAYSKSLSPLLNTPSADNVGMCPIHWACTEASIPHVALLWKHGANLEARDSSGCTPLLVAAQYGQVDVVAYLLKNGANIQAVDTSRDTALHWAAYKGSIQVCGLLAFYQSLSFTTQDAYGQTPLHLAALRGHTSVVRYILLQLPTKRDREILFLEDKNQRTPLDLAIHKNRPNVQAVLQEAMAAAEDPRGHFFRKTLVSNLLDFFRLSAWKRWLGISSPGAGDELDEPMRLPFYYLVANFFLSIAIFFGCFAPVFDAENGLLWEKSGFLLWNFVWMIATYFFFYKTWKTPPGYLDNRHPQIEIWRRRYEETLEAYADDTTGQNAAEKLASLPSLCHTCHIAKPPRSKHCRVSRKCVQLFDHYCPFVDNTIGLYNYRYFYLFLLSMSIGILNFGITLIIYLSRYRKAHGGSIPWIALMLGLEMCLCFLPTAGMLFYHTQLCMVNLSTNEHINVRKYPYLYATVNGRRQYRNPWFKGTLGNFMDRMFPSDACYLIPKESEPLVSDNSTGVEMV